MSISLNLRFFQVSLISCCLYNLVSSLTLRESYEFQLHKGFLHFSISNNVTVSFLNNAHVLLSDFNQQSSTRGFYYTSVGRNVDKVYGYYLCRGDISREICSDCILNGTKWAGKSMAEENRRYVGGSFGSGMCYFKYSNFDMYGLWRVSITNVGFIEANISNFETYNATFSSTMEDLIKEAAFESQKNGSVLGFATKEANVTADQTIYSLAQCTPDIIGENCSRCLKDMLDFSLRKRTRDTTAGYATNLKCHLRYDNVTFYDLGE